MATTIVSNWSAPVSFKVVTETLRGVEQGKLVAGDGSTYDYFALSVNISNDGNTALVGAYAKTTYRGAAYVFTRTNNIWSQQAKLLASDPAANDYFGYSVSLSSDGNTALIGAHYKNGTYSAQGAAYVFARSGTTWTQQAKLTHSDPDYTDQFGNSVSLSSDGNTALIGVSYKTGSAGSQQGAAYVFTRSGVTWSQQAKLVASDPASSDQFGWSVSLSGDGSTAAIGAYGKNNAAGAAYVFTRSGSTWSQQTKLSPGDLLPIDSFGCSISVSGDGSTVLVGADSKRGSYDNQGAAYVFTRSGSTWAQQAKVLAGDGSYGDRFGSAVSLSSDGNTALIGAFDKAGTSNEQGAGFIFTRSAGDWVQKAKVLASDAASNGYFGAGVGLSGDGNTAVIGAYGASNFTGAAYVFI